MTGAGPSLRVAVIDDHPLYRAAVLGVLAAGAGIEVVAACGSVEDFERSIVALAPAAVVVLLDLGLPGRSGVQAVAHLAGVGFRVLVLSASAARHQVMDVFAAGARGYLTKSAEEPEILAAVRAVGAGNAYVAPSIAPYLVWAVQGGALLSALTPREREVLTLLAAGRTDLEIAQELVIGLATVRSHLDHIRDKTGARRRADLTRWAVEEGLA